MKIIKNLLPWDKLCLKWMVTQVDKTPHIGLLLSLKAFSSNDVQWIDIILRNGGLLSKPYDLAVILHIR